MIQLGRFTLRNRVALAPMAGVTDLPFREIAWRCGAGLVVSEMVDVRPDFLHGRLAKQRRAHVAEASPRSVQIAGAEPAAMAVAAQLNIDEGAEVIDINMGCPAKQVCKRAAGSALMREPELVREILAAVVRVATPSRTPVTLKTRTGWDLSNRNGIEIARIAEGEGIALLTVHGRSRACRFHGAVEYETIAKIKEVVRIPVLANGDIDSPEKARWVVGQTGVDGVMIGRAALGRPWLLGQIAASLAGEEVPGAPTPARQRQLLGAHIKRVQEFHGAPQGVRLARKYVSWYLETARAPTSVRRAFNDLALAEEQLAFIDALAADWDAEPPLEKRAA